MAFYGYQPNFPQFPQNYPQNFQQPYQQNFQNQGQQIQAQPQQIQNGGFVSIRGEQEARNFPVQIGTSVTFKDETAPYIYTKTMGFSQLDTPRFEKFRLVKEDAPVVNAEAPKSDDKKEDIDLSIYATKSELGALEERIQALADDMEDLRTKKVTSKKKEVNEND